MARTMTPSGTPRPMPILAEALRPPGRGAGEVVRAVERTDVGEAGGEIGRREVGKWEVDMVEEVGVRELVDMTEQSCRDEEVGNGEESLIMVTAVTIEIEPAGNVEV